MVMQIKLVVVVIQNLTFNPNKGYDRGTNEL